MTIVLYCIVPKCWAQSIFSAGVYYIGEIKFQCKMYISRSEADSRQYSSLEATGIYLKVYTTLSILGVEFASCLSPFRMLCWVSNFFATLIVVSILCSQPSPVNDLVALDFISLPSIMQFCT